MNEVNSKITAAIKRYGVELPLEWRPLWNREYGDFGCDLPTKIAAVTKQNREDIGSSIVSDIGEIGSGIKLSTLRGYLNVRLDSSELLSSWAESITPRNSKIVLQKPSSRTFGLGYLRLAASAFLHWEISLLVNPSATLTVFGIDREFKRDDRDAALSHIILSANEIPDRSQEDDELQENVSHLLSSEESLATLWFAPSQVKGSFQDGYTGNSIRDPRILLRSPQKGYLKSLRISQEWQNSLAKAPRATVLYLALFDLPNEDLDPQVPTLHEAGNLSWYLSFCVDRWEKTKSTLNYEELLEDESLREKLLSLNKAQLLSKALNTESLSYGSVSEWGKWLKNSVATFHGILNNPKVRGASSPAIDEKVANIGVNPCLALTSVVDEFNSIILKSHIFNRKA